MINDKPLILVTNDDGIASPGIHAVARALAPLGEVVLVAPRDQNSSTGRSHPLHTDGMIEEVECCLDAGNFKAYAVGGTPAQCVLSALLKILPRKPDLAISGINYGENFGTGITISGTVGAALEAASFNIPTIAASLQLENIDDFDKHDPTVDFSVAGFFTHKFAKMLLERPLPAGVDLLKLEVPVHATEETPWRMTRLSRHMYYVPYYDIQKGWQDPSRIGFRVNVSREDVTPDCDVFAVVYDNVVAVTPLTIDMTAPIDIQAWEQELRQKGFTG
ncbi:MAG: 5'/3'-nucleotidase SurE [Anaerolineaceae bacterium]|jgi:5'-nucleotidase|nr:5'/3'-nucleotidase SurE [Anaerolineaceae bacterium]